MKENNDITTEISYIKNGTKRIIQCIGKGVYEGCYIGGYRYKLEVDIFNKFQNNAFENKTLACIMMNPSTTFPDKEWENPNWKNNLGFLQYNKNPRKTLGFDPTVVNVLKMADSKSYSKVCIFNLFPYIHPTGKIAVDKYNYRQIENKNTIKQWNDNNCKNILVAWGNNLPNKSNEKEYKILQMEYINLFKDKGIMPVYYEWNCNNNNYCPYHPSQQVNSCWTKNITTGEIVKKQKNDGKPGILQQFIDGNEDFKPFPKDIL